MLDVCLAHIQLADAYAACLHDSRHGLAALDGVGGGFHSFSFLSPHNHGSVFFSVVKGGCVLKGGTIVVYFLSTRGHGSAIWRLASAPHTSMSCRPRGGSTARISRDYISSSGEDLHQGAKA